MGIGQRGVGGRPWARACTNGSRASRYATSSATVMKVSSCCAANRSKSSCRAMEPSGFRISQITPAGYRPARRARSMLASVWPTRCSTPPGRARSGNTCPGRRRSEEHTSELQSQSNLVCRLLLEKKKTRILPPAVEEHGGPKFFAEVASRACAFHAVVHLVCSHLLPAYSSRFSPIVGHPVAPFHV